MQLSPNCSTILSAPSLVNLIHYLLFSSTVLLLIIAILFILLTFSIIFAIFIINLLFYLLALFHLFHFQIMTLLLMGDLGLNLKELSLYASIKV
jgi:hypothetical protein